MKVYLSYTASTEWLAAELAENLAGQGLELHTSQSFKAGESWERAAEKAMITADACVIMVGTGADRSQWQDNELTTVAEVSWTQPDKRIIPVLVGGARLPAILRDRQAVRIRKNGEDLPQVVDAVLAALRGKLPAVKKPQRAKAALRSQQKTRLQAIRQEAKQLEPSKRALRQQAERLRRQFEHERRAGESSAGPTAARLADVLSSLGETDEAVAYLQIALEAFRGLYGEYDDKVARTHAKLSRLLEKLGRIEEALGHLERAVAVYRKGRGSDALIVAMTQLQLAFLLEKAGRTEEASALRAEIKAHFRNLSKDLVKQLPDLLKQSIPVLGPVIAPFISAWISPKKTTVKTARAAKDPAAAPGPKQHPSDGGDGDG